MKNVVALVVLVELVAELVAVVVNFGLVIVVAADEVIDVIGVLEAPFELLEKGS